MNTSVMLSFPWEDEEAERAREAAARVPSHLTRLVARASDRRGWLRARARGVTGTDVARLSSRAAVDSVAYEKLNGTGFSGNVFTEHGKTREPEIAGWVLREHGIEASDGLFHAERDPRHLATPDGIRVDGGDSLVLCEIKTTSKAWRSIPRSYLRQVWWQQYVLGAERTLVVWEQHEGFVPIGAAPLCRWVERDESEIEVLVRRADELLAAMRETWVRRR